MMSCLNNTKKLSLLFPFSLLFYSLWFHFHYLKYFHYFIFHPLYSISLLLTILWDKKCSRQPPFKTLHSFMQLLNTIYNCINLCLFFLWLASFNMASSISIHAADNCMIASLLTTCGITFYICTISLWSTHLLLTYDLFCMSYMIFFYLFN